MNAAVTTQKTETATPSVPRRTARPHCDVYEGATGFQILADVPGVDPGDVTVTLEQNLLSLSAVRRYGDGEGQLELAFERTFHVPKAVDPDALTANLSDGVLTLDLPKHQKARKRQIEVQVV